MKYFDGIITVEGKEDVCYLSSFIKAEYVILNGYSLSDIEYLKRVSKFKKIILLTDSDQAGKDIRAKVNNIVDELINIEVDINKCNKRNKKGIAECDKEEILSKLNPYLKDIDTETKSDISIVDILNIGKENIMTKYNIEKCNNKKLLQRLHSLGITKKDLYGN